MGQVTNGDAVTWVGILSGGVPVAAAAIVVVAVLWRRLNVALAHIDAIQNERLTDVRELAPLVKSMGDVMIKATVALERQVSSNQAGGR